MSDFNQLIPCAGGFEQDLIVLPESTVEDSYQNYDASVIVILAVEYKRFGRSGSVSLGSRNSVYYLLHHSLYVYAVFCAYLRAVLRRYAYYLLYLIFDPLRICGGKIYLVYNREYLKIIVHCQICI